MWQRGSICLFIHNSLMFKLRSDLGTNSNHIESLTIEINKRKQNVVIIAQYRQPAGDFKQYKIFCISSNKHPQRLLNFETVRCGAE